MSRGVKDLRELICVSRLTIRGSDEEVEFSEDEREEAEEEQIGSSQSSESDSRQGSAQSLTGWKRDTMSPDSGIGTNGRPTSPEVPETTPSVGQIISISMSSSSRKKKKKKKKKTAYQLETIPQKHDLPRPPALPPVPQGSHPHSSHPASGSDGSVAITTDANRGAAAGAGAGCKPGNYDHLLMYLDLPLVSEWLAQANKHVTDLATWCHTDDNFVCFAHFWLCDFPDPQKQDIFKLEHGIVLDSLGLAFGAGRSTGKVKHRDVARFLDAVFREYPERLISSRGAHLFLDHLDVLSSEKRSAYRKLLSDAKCSTGNTQYAQATLAIRAFVLVSVWYAVLNFYRKLLTLPKGGVISTVPITAIGKTCPNHGRMVQAIRNGFTDVIHYLLASGKVKVTDRDAHGRNIVFSAVVHNQAKVVHYLLHQVKPPPAVNDAADNGNTPLHAAANHGNAKLVQSLLEAPSIVLDPTNPQCENATPLHLAAMHGHTEVVWTLLSAGANGRLKMGDLDPLQLAADFGHEEIARMLSEGVK